MSNSPTTKPNIVRWFATRPQPLTVQGEVSANRVDLSPRVVSDLGVDVGDTIEGVRCSHKSKAPSFRRR